MSKPIRPVSRVSLESVVSRDKYHTYVVKRRFTSKPAKDNQRAYVTKND